eukprot:gb/GECH01009699.1/.p1 GENE.gb/GECH01009699.1/~~gb/GECH01009699.1/.p1  ORF type:complete len:965 (+),score=295.88 gb/GECH01009699.1/:1-2895(+)
MNPQETISTTTTTHSTESSSTNELEQIDLSHQKLEEIDSSMINYVASFKHLRYLDLSHNELSWLPADLSSWTSIEQINLIDNPISELSRMLPGLSSMPRLRHLEANLTEEQEEELIIELTQIDTLNGVYLNDDDPIEEGAGSNLLEKEVFNISPRARRTNAVDNIQMVKQISENQRIRKDITSSSSTQEMDLNVHFQNDLDQEEKFHALTSLREELQGQLEENGSNQEYTNPKKAIIDEDYYADLQEDHESSSDLDLTDESQYDDGSYENKHLDQESESKNQEQELNNGEQQKEQNQINEDSLSSCESNQKMQNDKIETDDKENEEEIKEDETLKIEDFDILSSSIFESRKKKQERGFNIENNFYMDSNEKEETRAIFDKMKNLRNRLNMPSNDYDEFLEKHFNYLSKENNMKTPRKRDKLGAYPNSFSSRANLYHFLLRESTQVVRRFCPELSLILHQINSKMTQTISDFSQTFQSIREHYLNEISRMREELNHAGTEMKHLIEAAETLENEMRHNQGSSGQRNKIHELQKENERLLEENGWLQADNEQIQADLKKMKLLSSNKNTASHMKSLPMSPKRYNMTNSTPLKNDSKAWQQTIPQKPGAAKHILFNSTPKSSDNHLFHSIATPSSKSHHNPSTFKSPKSKSLTASSNPSRFKENQGTHRVLSLKQMRDVIEDIYASKQRFDEKCKEQKLPRETMEQHLFTYLNQKYGLRSIILDWAYAIIDGIKKFSPEDNDVCVFGKILKHDIDEEFRHVQNQLKETVSELYRAYLRGKHPNMISYKMDELLQKKKNGVMREDEWVDVVRYMYNKEDSMTILSKVRQHCFEHQQYQTQHTPLRSRQERHSKLLNKREISFKDFLKVLLDFQLEGHERFLRKFCQLFRRWDQDKDGIINEMEFRQLVQSMDEHKSHEDLNLLLNTIDPYNYQQISFSDAVSILSTEIVQYIAKVDTPYKKNEKDQQS